MSCNHALVAIGALILPSGPAAAADAYPAKPIRIVTSPAGGAADFVARLIAREIAAPLGQPIVLRLNREIARALTLADIKERFFNAGAETVSTSPEQFRLVVKAEMAKFGKLIKDAGIHEK